MLLIIQQNNGKLLKFNYIKLENTQETTQKIQNLLCQVRRGESCLSFRFKTCRLPVPRRFIPIIWSYSYWL